ncbi:MAG TPA: hypothetical protein VFC78_20845 [Tepidisphaeraceae bacterium]|nr:hypothetical protein [Tepidisphaeraceae bacterium]
MKTQKKQPEWRRPVDAKSGKPYTEMTTDELREATREFDQPMFVERKSRAMTPAERAQYRRMLNGTAARRNSAPRQISISMDPLLLKRADAYARRRRMSRSELVAKGLEAVIGSAA